MSCFTMKEHHKLFKCKNFKAIVNKETPNCLKALLPNTFGSVRCNSRCPDNYFNVKTRTETSKSSFIPSSVNL